MQDTTKVSVVEFGDRQHYQMQWRDPLTGKKKTKSTGVERTGRKKDRDAAQRVAGELETALQSGTFATPPKITWGEFRERYEAEAQSGLAMNTQDKTAGVLNVLERIASPARLWDLTAQRLSRYQAKLREEGRAEQTIKSHMAHIAAALAWAVKMGMLPKAPAIESPKRAKGQKVMKGRPITREEFERMLVKVEAGLLASTPAKKLVTETRPRKRPFRPETVTKNRERLAKVAAAAAASWQYYLEGLWLSGLRLGESLDLWWDRDDKLCVDLSGKRPMLRIPAALEKGNQERVLPMSPEFAEFLLQTPPPARTGRVFDPDPIRGSNRPTEHRVGEVVSKIGKAAGVKVNTTAAGKVKFASAHDLRRSFGERWATRVMPQVLMELMRHDSIDTTLRFYVGRNAQATADVLWEAHHRASNTLGNSRQNSPADSCGEVSANRIAERT